MGYYESLLQELQKQRKQLRSDVSRMSEEARRRAIQNLARRGLSFSGVAQQQLADIRSKADEALARGESAISQKEAEITAARRAEAAAKRAAIAQMLGTAVGAGIGLAAGGPAGALTGAQLGSLAGTLAGGLMGYEPGFTATTTQLAGVIASLSDDELARLAREIETGQLDEKGKLEPIRAKTSKSSIGKFGSLAANARIRALEKKLAK